mgnify:CR=1 FL=1
MKQTDLRTAYGRLGMHPGDMGPQEAQVIFEQATARGGGVFVEVSPGTGRATAILGIAARNVGAKLYAVDALAIKNPAENRWFNLAVLCHQLTGVVRQVEPGAVKAILNGGGADLLLLNGDCDFSTVPLKDDCAIILRKATGLAIPAECIVDHRPVISVWRRTVVPPATSPI